MPEQTPVRAREAARLHRELLPTSPLSGLGEPFLARYYYRRLPESGLLNLGIAHVDGEPAGFIAVTKDARGFQRKATRVRPILLALHLFLAVLRRPASVRELLRGITTARGTEHGLTAPGDGEILSFGVRQKYRGLRFSQLRPGAGPPGQTVAGVLLAGALERLQREGAQRVRAVIDEDNTPARIMYASLGWYSEGNRVSGWDVPCVEYFRDLS